MPSATSEDEITRVFMFESTDGKHLGFSNHSDGRTLPVGTNIGRWNFVSSFALAADRIVPANLPPEPILRGLLDVGFYVWRKGEPHATSQ